MKVQRRGGRQRVPGDGRKGCDGTAHPDGGMKEPGVATTRSSDGTACPDGVAMEFSGESMECSGRGREMRLREGVIIAVDATTSPMVVH